MRGYNILILLVACMVFGMGTMALANEPYVKLMGGLTYPEDADTNRNGIVAELEFDTGYTVSGAVGYKFTSAAMQRFAARLEMELNYSKNEFDKISVTRLAPALSVDNIDFPIEVDVEGEASAISLMLNAYYDFEISKILAPYFGGGIGFSRYDVETKNLTIGDVSVPFAYEDDEIGFTGAIMAGIHIPINERLSLGVEYRLQYFDTDLINPDDNELLFYQNIQLGLVIAL